jgi:type IV pilus assembly protein PilQ
VPWDQALDIVLQSGPDMRKAAMVLVAPRDEIKPRKLELEARNQIADLEPLRSEAFVVNYQKAEEVRRLLTDEKQRLISKRGSVGVDPRTNQLFVQDTASRIEDVRRLLQRIDIPVPQVLIEARIVEAEDEFSRNLGVRFGYGRVTNEAAVGGNNLLPTLPGGTGGSTTGRVRSSTRTMNLPAAEAGGLPAGQFALTLFNSSLTRLVNLELSALEADGRGKIISSPRVVTADKVKAIIEQGTEIPYQEATSSGATSVSFRKAVLKLEVTPQITPEGAIFMDVKVNKDQRAETLSGPAIDTKNVQTQVLVENGGTVVLGGIYEQQDRTTVTKVPLFGDLPVVGWLFKNESKINDRTELIIFITPRVISERVNAACA